MLVNKTVALYVYAVKDNQVVWSYTSDAITVNPKNTADVVKATAADVEYNGKIQQAVPTVTTVSDLQFTGTELAVILLIKQNMDHWLMMKTVTM